MRDIAGHFGLAKSSLHRHAEARLPLHLVEAQQQASVFDAETLLRPC